MQKYNKCYLINDTVKLREEDMKNLLGQSKQFIEIGEKIYSVKNHNF